MKKIAITLFVIVFCIISHAQVQLIHSFENIDYDYSQINFETISEPVDCYVIIQGSSIHIYNPNFVLEKTITLNLSDFSWHPDFHPTIMSSIAVYPVGRHLINADDKIEMIADARAEERYYNEYGQECSEYGNSTSTIIINEDGDIVHDFGHTIIYYVFDFGVGEVVHKVGDQLRLAAWTYGPPYQYDEYGNIVYSTSYLNIYSLGGNYNPSTMATYTQPAGFPNPYPNPSRNTVTLPYTLQPGETSQLRVFNMNGQLLETFHIGSDFDKILLNVSNYPKGTYIYTYNGVSKKFVVQ